MAKKPTVYDIELTDLIERFGNACAHSGVANSGLCISFGGGYAVIDVQYLRGALLARFRGKTPPFEPGQKVRMKKDALERYRWKPNPPDRILTIERVFFRDPDRWELVFKEYDQFDDNGRLCDRYQAERFEVVDADVEATIV